MSDEILIDEEKELTPEELVDNMTLFSDDLMSKVFDENIEATELLLRIILGRPVKVLRVKGQYEIRNPRANGRTIRLDIVAQEENGDKIDVEVQGDSEGAHVRRARYHSSALDNLMLNKKQEFKDIKDSYVIFIYKHDKFGAKLPIYHVERYVEETKEKFDDGSHIIYVNGKYEGDDEIGKLIKDFHSLKSEGMHYKEFAEGVRHFKETEEGREIMCKEVEVYADRKANKVATQTKTSAVMELMKNLKLTLEDALDALSIQGDERAIIAKQIQK